LTTTFLVPDGHEALADCGTSVCTKYSMDQHLTHFVISSIQVYCISF